MKHSQCCIVSMQAELANTGLDFEKLQQNNPLVSLKPMILSPCSGNLFKRECLFCPHLPSNTPFFGGRKEAKQASLTYMKGSQQHRELLWLETAKSKSECFLMCVIVCYLQASYVSAMMVCFAGPILINPLCGGSNSSPLQVSSSKQSTEIHKGFHYQGIFEKTCRAWKFNFFCQKTCFVSITVHRLNFILLIIYEKIDY